MFKPWGDKIWEVDESDIKSDTSSLVNELDGLLLENDVILPDDLDLSAFLNDSDDDDDSDGDTGAAQPKYEYMGVMYDFDMRAFMESCDASQMDDDEIGSIRKI